eukprot:g4417.t1
MRVPIVDFAGYDESDPASIQAIARDVDAALSGIGFMSIKNHGIDPKLVEEIFAAAKYFFGLDLETKNRLGYSAAEENFGYLGVRSEALEPGMPADLKEALSIRDGHKHLDANWPSEAFRDLLLTFYDECFAAARRVMRVFAAVLDVDSEYFVDKHQGENVTFRMLHYPQLDAEVPDQMGAGAHTDYGMVTLLLQDMIGGLEVYDKKAGRWESVDPVPGSIVINTGDLTERWTNGRFLSTLHRVKPRGGVGDRYSVVMFFDPDPGVTVDCLPSCVSEDNPAKYEPFSTYINGTLVIQGDCITAVGAAEEVEIPVEASVIDGKHRLAILPGLIDAHSHSSLLKGYSENAQLMDWLPEYQREHQALREYDAYLGCLVNYMEALKGGTTTVMDMYRFLHMGAKAAGELGIRAHLVPYAADHPTKQFFETLETTEQLIRDCHNSFDGRKFWEAGINVGLGSDGGVSNNSVSMWECMKVGSLLQKVTHLDATAVTAEQAIRMATIEGAEAQVLITNATILTLADGEETPFVGHIYVDDDGRIASVGEGPYLDSMPEMTEQVDATGMLVIPGFVSGHNHLWQAAFRGIAQDGVLYPWLEALHWTYGDYFSEGDFYTFTMLGALDHLVHGITTTYNHSQRLAANEAQYLESLEAELDAGQHFVFAYNADMNAGVAAMTEKFEAFMQQAEVLMAEPDALMLGASLNVVGSYRGMEFFEKEIELAEKYGITGQIHYLEQYSRSENDRTKWSSFLQAGAVAENISYAHFIHTTDQILTDTAERGGAMIWNPLSNGRLASGLADIPRYQQLGVRVGMGVDGAASGDISDPFENMRMGMYALRMQYKEATVMSPMEVLRLHTLKTAEVLGVDDKVGSLEVGKLGDILVINPDSPATGAVFDPASHLVFALSADNIDQIYVAGELKVKNGASILCEQGTILDMGADIRADAADLNRVDCSGLTAYPGLINTHHHFFQSFVRNQAGLDWTSIDVMEWISSIYPIFSLIDEDAIYHSSIVSMCDLIKHGCTTAMDHQYNYSRHAGKYLVDRQFEAAEKLGMRYVAGRGCNTLPQSQGSTIPDEMLETTDEFIADCERLIHRYHQHERGAMRQIVVSPCQPINGYQDTFVESARLAREHGVSLHTHLGEGEDAGIRERTGMSSVEWCEAIDFVGPDVFFAHGWAFTGEEISRLAQSGTGVSHCPGPVFLVGEEITPVPEMYAKGMRISLGCDGSASNDNSNLAECIRAAYQLQCLVAKSHDYAVPSPYEFFRFATQGGADCLNRSDIGRLEDGKACDFFAIDLNRVEYVGAAHDPLSLPAKVGFSSTVDMTVVNGKPVWKDGEFDNLLGALTDFELEKIETVKGAKFHLGEAYGQELVLFQSGIGLVNAAMTLQIALDHFEIERILFSGVAGGAEPSLKKGDLSIASSWHYYEYGARFTADPETGEYRVPEFMQSRISEDQLDGFFPYPMRAIREGLDEPVLVPEFATDAELLSVARALASDIELVNAHGEPATILTDTVGGSGLAFNDSADIRDFIREKWGTASVDMESAALAHVAWVNQVPILQVRAISDLVGNENPQEFYEFKAVAELNAARFVDRMIEKLD